jgi:hypothetical protein
MAWRPFANIYLHLPPIRRQPAWPSDADTSVSGTRTGRTLLALRPSIETFQNDLFENVFLVTRLSQWLPALFKLSIMPICLNFFLGGETEAHSAFIAENAEQYYLA